MKKIPSIPFIDFTKAIEPTLFTGFLKGTFISFLYFLIGIAPNFLLGFLEIQQKGYSQTIIIVFFATPVIGYLLLGVKKGLQKCANYFWKHFLESFVHRYVAPEIAIALIRTATQTAAVEKLTGEVLVDKISHAIILKLGVEHHLITKILKFLLKIVIKQYVFDVTKNTSSAILQETLAQEIYQKINESYQKQVSSLKFGSSLLEGIVTWVLPFLIYFNVGLVLWYYLQNWWL